MRLFVALDVPDEVVERLAAAVAPVRARHPDLNWSATSSWHVTLAFLGEVEEGRLGEVVRVVGPVAGEGRRIDLRLGDAGRFGRRVCWLGVVDDPAGEVALLGGRLQAALGEARLPVDAKPVHPHVTLARARGRRGVLPRHLVDDVPRVAGRWTADEVVLYRSHLGDGAPRYEPLHRFPLVPR